jgi:hypothetical protein
MSSNGPSRPRCPLPRTRIRVRFWIRHRLPEEGVLWIRRVRPQAASRPGGVGSFRRRRRISRQCKSGRRSGRRRRRPPHCFFLSSATACSSWLICRSCRVPVRISRTLLLVLRRRGCRLPAHSLLLALHVLFLLFAVVVVAGLLETAIFSIRLKAAFA